MNRLLPVISMNRISFSFLRIAGMMLGACIVAASCHSGTGTLSNAEDTVVVAEPETPDTIAPSLLKGKSLEEAVAVAGPSDEATEFYMSNSLSEFRVSLYNYFKAKDYEHQRILIKEVTWYNGENNITIWYREENLTWKFIEMLVWDKDAEF